MKTKLITLILCLFLLTGVFGMIACSPTPGEKGENGKDGVGITTIIKSGTNGNIDTYSIVLSNGATVTFTVTNGTNGEDGQDGVGIANITISANGQLVITLTNGNTFTLDMPTGGGSFVPTHNFGEWQTFSGENLPCDQRVFFTTCTICGEMKFKHGTENDHNFNKTYTFDSTYHWFECQNCSAINGKAKHVEDENGECSVCTAPIGDTVGVFYDISADGTYAEVVGYKGTATKIKIADTYNNLPVKVICEDAFYQNNNITSVIIPDSVTSIGDYAFSSCSSLTSVTFEDASNWYRTENYNDWQNQTNGTAVDVTSPTKNATTFKYDNNYWYKIEGEE